MRRRLALAVLALGAAVVLPAAPAQACTGTVCDLVNYVCSLGSGGGCIPD